MCLQSWADLRSVSQTCLRRFCRLQGEESEDASPLQAGVDGTFASDVEAERGLSPKGTG